MENTPKKLTVEEYIRLYGDFAPVQLDLNGDGFIDEEEIRIANEIEETKINKIKHYYF